MQHFTPEMALKANIAMEADKLRRNAKLKRLHPDASPYTNLMADWLAFDEGDPERMEDFMEQAEAIARAQFLGGKDTLFVLGKPTISTMGNWPGFGV